MEKDQLIKKKEELKRSLANATDRANDVSQTLKLINQEVSSLQNELMKVNAEITTKLIKS